MKNIFISLPIVILMLGCSQQSNLEMNLQQSESFLEQNLLNSSIIEIEPGLQYLILDSPEGNSSRPTPSDTITADFHGTLMDGTVFWSFY
jgi:FKBP-type peptidyl-prolyl cis-trans isomerase